MNEEESKNERNMKWLVSDGRFYKTENSSSAS